VRQSDPIRSHALHSFRRAAHPYRAGDTRAGHAQPEITILDDVIFSVPAQSLFAINGPSGSGKSTVLNMLTGLDYE
jgi:ABC-type multidrug transport system ATPase subunit